MTDGARDPDGTEPEPRRSQRRETTPWLASEILAAHFDGRSSRDEIRGVLRPVCQEARRSRTGIAELVKAVKAAFAASDMSHLRDSGERQETLDRIVSVCIEEYYAAN